MPVLPGDDSYYWLAPDGSVFDFTDRAKWGVLPGDGFGVPKDGVENVERQTPYGPGAEPLYSRFKPRDITLRVFIKSIDYPTQQLWRQQLVAAFSAFQNTSGVTGSLKILRANGTLRQIDGVLKGGPTFDAAGRMGLARKEEILIHCGKPFWYDPTAVTLALSSRGAGGAPLTYPQTLPFSLGGATGSGIPLATTTNGGDWEAFPLITLPGPCLNPTIANYTTGKALSWTGAVPAGYTLAIDCNEINPTVTLTDALGNAFNAYYGLTAAATFWSVVPGVNSIGFTAATAGANPALTYFARYSGI